VFFIDIYVKTDGVWNKVNVQNGSKIKYMAPTMIEFYIVDIDGEIIPCQAEPGMTWSEWINSSYSQNDIFTWTIDYNFGGRIAASDTVYSYCISDTENTEEVHEFHSIKEYNQY
jgi:hypothetical protein